jgi:hypothetical protein
VGGSDKNAQDKSDKNAKAALTLATSDSGNVSKGKSSSNSSGTTHQAAPTAPPTTATAATSQSAQNEPQTVAPDKSTEPKAATSKNNTVTNLPRVPRKTSPMTLYTDSALHMVDLPSVTSEDSWNSTVSTLNETQKNELLNRMATFALDLQKVDKSVNDKPILAPRRKQMREDLEALLASSTRLTAIPDFVHPVIISQGPTAAGYAGTGLGDVLNLVDNNSSLDIWKHLRRRHRTCRILHLHDVFPRLPVARPCHSHRSYALSISALREQRTRTVSRRRDFGSGCSDSSPEQNQTRQWRAWTHLWSKRCHDV